MGIARSTYYFHRTKGVKPDRYQEVRPFVRDVFDHAYRSYGYRRVRAKLASKHGFCLSGKTVLRLMREENRVCQVRRRKYRSYRGNEGLVAPNVLARDFASSAPNLKWVTDVTEFMILGRKQYLSPVIDLFNGEVVSYEVQQSPSMFLVSKMLEKALAKIPEDSKLTMHSDQGWQYRHIAYRQALEKHGVVQSMSRKGNCLDNAVAENFFGHFKEEFLRQKTFTSHSQFRRELDEYIRWFNNDRIKLKLKGLSPVDYRTQSLARLPLTLT